jgi:nicotinate-nucleotide adenylyltransferase
MSGVTCGSRDSKVEAARLGVIGGTFDPPHYGHLVLAENARVQLALDAVLFVPAGQPPHKPEGPLTPAHHRVAMLEAAIAGNAAFMLSTVDLDRPGPHYTVDMLGILSRKYLADVIPAIRDRVTLLDAPYLEISGADLRRRVRSRLPIRYLVPPSVEQYVREQGLYGVVALSHDRTRLQPCS